MQRWAELEQHWIQFLTISVSFSLSNTIPSIFIILRWSLEYCSMYCYRDVCLYFLSHLSQFYKVTPTGMLRTLQSEWACCSFSNNISCLLQKCNWIGWKEIERKKNQLTGSTFSWQIKFHWHYILGEENLQWKIQKAWRDDLLHF